MCHCQIYEALPLSLFDSLAPLLGAHFLFILFYRQYCLCGVSMMAVARIVG